MIPKVRIYIEDFVKCVQDFPLKFIFQELFQELSFPNRTKFDLFDLYLFLYNRKTTSKYTEALQNTHMYLEAAQMRNNFQISISINNNDLNEAEFGRIPYFRYLHTRRYT